MNAIPRHADSTLATRIAPPRSAEQDESKGGMLAAGAGA